MWLFYVMGAILAVGGVWLAFNLVRGLWAVATGKGGVKVRPMTLEELMDETDELTTNPAYSSLLCNIHYDDDD